MSFVNMAVIFCFDNHPITSSLKILAYTTSISALRVKCPYWELYWSEFSRIQTEYREILRISVSLHIQSECGKIRTRITLNTDTFHAVQDWQINLRYILHLVSFILDFSEDPSLKRSPSYWKTQLWSHP